MKKALILTFLGVFLCIFDVFAFDYSEAKEAMINDQIIARGVKDLRVIEAMRKVDRHLFVPEYLISQAYGDGPLPIGYGQTISQPYVIAFMTEALDLDPGDTVLEIGTGSGYQAAILAQIVKQVYTIEIIKPLADESQERLNGLGYTNIEVKCGDGYLGWPEFSPFDKIIVTAAPDEVPRELVNQLKIGGKMIVPIGSAFQELYLITKTEDGFTKKAVLPVRFVPMVKGKSMNKKIILLISIIAVVFLIAKIIPMLGSDKEKIRKVILDAKAATEKENALKCISFVSMDYEDRHGNNRGSLFMITQNVFKSYDDILIIIEDLRIEIVDNTHARAKVIASGQSRRIGEQELRYFLDSERVEFNVDFEKEGNAWKVVKLDFIEPREFMQFLMGI